MSEERYWLNIDIPTQKCTVHKTDCTFKPKKSKFKGVRSLDRDGGWMPFSDRISLLKYRLDSFRDIELHFCSFCKPFVRDIDIKDLHVDPIFPQTIMCPYCGNLLPPTGSTCTACGREFDWEDAYQLYLLYRDEDATA